MTRLLFDDNSFAFADSYIGLLPAERQCKALRYVFDIDRRLCISCYLLLRSMCAELGIDISGHKINTGRYGKPYLPDLPAVEFSFSHCRKCAGCSVSDRSIGLDVEETLDVSSEAAVKLLGGQVSAAPDEFTRLWTVKEASAKFIGSGIFVQSTIPLPDNVIVTSQKTANGVWTTVCSLAPETIETVTVRELLI